MKQLRFTTSKPGFMGTTGVPFVTPKDIQKLIYTKTIARYAYIHGDAEKLTGYDIPIFLDGDIGQLDLPIDTQDILMLLIGNEYKCKAELVDSRYHITLK